MITVKAWRYDATRDKVYYRRLPDLEDALEGMGVDTLFGLIRGAVLTKKARYRINDALLSFPDGSPFAVVTIIADKLGVYTAINANGDVEEDDANQVK